MRRILLAIIAFLYLPATTCAAFGATDSPLTVRDFGAVGDGIVLDTGAAQKAIDACAAAGGGTVFFSGGVYLCGSLHLRSGVTLFLDGGATIKSSLNNADFDPVEKLGFKNDADTETSFFHHALIWGEDVERIGIVGQGTIDGNRTKRGGPKNIALKRCKYVSIRGVRLLNCPNYNISMLGTDYVNIDGVTVQNGYADGIDPDACHNVRIANCHIESRDDALVLKTSFSLGERRSCENVSITNCFLASRANCFALGTETGGDFKSITLSNCIMTNFTGDIPGGNHATSGISLRSVDGANVNGIAISNVVMQNVCCPVFIRLGGRLRDRAPAPGSIRNVIISNLVATNASWTSSITGIPGYCPEGITLSNVRLEYTSGGPIEARKSPVPEHETKYPTANMFGALPAYGLYCRHAKDLVLSNVRLQCSDRFVRLPLSDKKRNDNPYWQTPETLPDDFKGDDAGAAFVAEDVNGLDIETLQARASAKGEPVLWFIDVRDAFIHGSRAPGNTNVYLDIHGKQTNRITMTGNALQKARKGVRRSSEVRKGAVRGVGE